MPVYTDAINICFEEKNGSTFEKNRIKLPKTVYSENCWPESRF